MQKVEGSSPFTRSNSPSRGEAEDRSDVLCRLPFVVRGARAGRRSQVVRQRSAKPPSSVQLRSPPPTPSLHLAISGGARPRTQLPNRQNCRHSADETRRHEPIRARKRPSRALDLVLTQDPLRPEREPLYLREALATHDVETDHVKVWQSVGKLRRRHGLVMSGEPREPGYRVEDWTWEARRMEVCGRNGQLVDLQPRVLLRSQTPM